jgi:26S proteasome regulatory subunit N1
LIDTQTHLAEAGGMSRRTGGNASAAVDSARANLASTFVNAFVNAGFGVDKLMTEENTAQLGNAWIYKNKDVGMTCAAASLGMVLMWNVDEGLNQIDKYFHNSEDYVKAGACLAMGILSAGVRNESDPALALLTDYLDNPSKNIRRAAICGLGIAYAGARREEISDLLMPLAAYAGENSDIIESSLAALALGMVFVGTANDEIGSVLVQRLMESSEDDLNNTISRYLCLGLGLVYLGKSENADVILEAVRTVVSIASWFAFMVVGVILVSFNRNISGASTRRSL